MTATTKFKQWDPAKQVWITKEWSVNKEEFSKKHKLTNKAETKKLIRANA